MAKYVMKKQQRGPTLKLNFSVIRQGSDCNEKATESINIDDLALVIITLKGINDTNDLQIGIKMKKKEGAEKVIVPVTIVCEEIEEQLICPNKWVERKIKVKSVDSYISYLTTIVTQGYYQNNKQESTLLYSFEVNITINATVGISSVAIPSVVMKRLYENTEFTDFQLKATDGAAVPVHKAVLAVHSDMFKTMLQREDWTETKEGCINVKDVTVETLQHLKDYMYLGILPDEDLDSLLIIASYYLMDRLKAECIAKMVKSVTPDDLENLVEFACENNMPDLMKAILFQTPDHTVTSAYQLTIEN